MQVVKKAICQMIRTFNDNMRSAGFGHLFLSLAFFLLGAGLVRQDFKGIHYMKNSLHKIIKISLLLIFISCPAEAAGKDLECVVLLHGLARTERSFQKLEGHLEKNGYYVVNRGYPSREKTIQELSVEAIATAKVSCLAAGAKKIHFVTHSMGGILVRYYLEYNEVPQLGRVVMLSPPNQGSEVVDELKETPIYKWINGPAGQQLGTDADSLPKTLGDPDYELGIITGDRSINPILSLMIPGEDDGKVSVENAKLAGMKDFLVVHKTHPLIMNDEKVLQEVTTFLKKGIFDRETDERSD
jgi:triacylglycerol lipase